MMKEERYQRLRRQNQMAQRRKRMRGRKKMKEPRRDSILKYYTPKNPTVAESSWMAAHGTNLIPLEVRDKWDRKMGLSHEEALQERRDREQKTPPLEDNILSEFYEDSCIVQDGMRCRPRELFLAYLTWCDGGRARFRMGSKSFSLQVRRRFQYLHSHGKTYFVGLTPR